MSKMKEERKQELQEEKLEKVNGGTAEDIVDRVLRGDFGNGQERRESLREAGYDYEQVRKKVEERLGYNTRHPEF